MKSVLIIPIAIFNLVVTIYASVGIMVYGYGLTIEDPIVVWGGMTCLVLFSALCSFLMKALSTD
jgi:hypothetical protein